MRILPEDTREYARQIQALPEAQQRSLLPRTLSSALQPFRRHPQHPGCLGHRPHALRNRSRQARLRAFARPLHRVGHPVHRFYRNGTRHRRGAGPGAQGGEGRHCRRHPESRSRLQFHLHRAADLHCVDVPALPTPTSTGTADPRYRDLRRPTTGAAPSGQSGRHPAAVNLVAIETADPGILAVASDGTSTDPSPGIALLNGPSPIVGRAAAEQARLLPRRIHDRFWERLNDEPLEKPHPVHLTTADLVHAHLREIRADLPSPIEGTLIAVPGHSDRRWLGFLLGVMEVSEFPVRGLVDAAVAGVAREGTARGNRPSFGPSAPSDGDHHPVSEFRGCAATRRIRGGDRNDRISRRHGPAHCGAIRPCEPF